MEGVYTAGGRKLGKSSPPGEGQEWEHGGSPSIFTHRLNMEIKHQSRNQSIGQGHGHIIARWQSKCPAHEKVEEDLRRTPTGFILANSV